MVGAGYAKAEPQPTPAFRGCTDQHARRTVSNQSATQTQNNHHVCHTIDCPTHPGLGCGIHTDLLLRLGTNTHHSQTRSLTPS